MTAYVESIIDLPQNSNYVYHVTYHSNVESILSNGLNNFQNPDWKKVNNFLKIVAKLENIKTKPKDRSNCVFTYPRFAEVAESSTYGVLSIDLRKIKQNKYRGNYKTVTEIYEYLSNSNPKYIIKNKDEYNDFQEQYDKAVTYWNNMEKCSSSVSKGGEVLIEDGVKPEAITHVYAHSYE